MSYTATGGHYMPKAKESTPRKTTAKTSSSTKGMGKVGKVMHEYKLGTLKSGEGGPVRLGERVAVGVLRLIAGEDQARRREGVLRAMPALEEERVTELVAAPELVVGRHRGFPADAEVDAQMGGGPEGILHISGHDRLAQVIGNHITVRQAGRAVKAADQQVRQPIARDAAVERELAVGLLVVKGIELVLAAIEAESDLVLAADEGEIVGHLVGVDVEVGEGAGAAAHVESAPRIAAHAELRIVGDVDEHVDAQILRAEQVGRRSAVVPPPVEGGVERVDGRGAEGIRVADGHGLGTVLVAGASRGQGVLAIEQRLGQVVVDEVPPIELLLAADVVIDAANPLVVRIVGEIAEVSQPARVGGNRNVRVCQFKTGGIERGHGNLVAGIQDSAGVLQSSRRGETTAVCLGAIHHTEVALQRSHGRVVGLIGRRIAALPGALIAAEEEQLVFDDAEERRVGKECRSRWSPYH